MALSKPRPILQDMPLHIKDQIAKSLDSNFDRMILRNSHPDFRRVIGNPKIKPHYLNLYFFNQPNPIVRLMMKGNSVYNEIWYKSVPEGTQMIKEENGLIEKVFVPEKHGNFIDLMVEVLACLLDNPNFEVRSFEVACSKFVWPSMAFDELHWQEFLSKIEKVLRNLKHKLKTDYLVIDCLGKQENLLKILPYINTSSLRVDSLKKGQLDGVDELIHHWKHIDQLTMFDLPDNKLPIEQWWDFPKTQMTLKHTSLADIKRLIQHFRRSSTFVECILYTTFRPEQFKKALGKIRTALPYGALPGEKYFVFPARATLKKIYVLVYPRTTAFVKIYCDS